MIRFDRLKTIVKLASPIMVGMLTINLMTLVDTAMVGSLGSAALAGVGMGAFLNALMGSMFQGIAAGVQALVSRRLGENALEGTWPCLIAGMTVGLVAGSVVASLAYIFAPAIFGLMSEDPAVWNAGVPYFRMVTLSLVLQTLNYMFRGFWNGRHRPRVYMNALIFLFFCNAGLNYVFIFGKLGFPAMGTAGAGLGTAVAMALTQVYYWFVTLPHFRSEGARLRLPDGELFLRLIKVGLPSGLQDFSALASLTLFLHFVAELGTLALAVATVLVRLLTVAYLPAAGLGMAAATLVGTSLGQKDPEAATRWGADIFKIGFTAITVAGVLAALFSPLLLRIFLHEEDALAAAHLPSLFAFSCVGVSATSMIVTYALVGAGASKYAMILNMLQQWLLFQPLTLLAIRMGADLTEIFIVQLGTQVLLLLALAWIWRRGRWHKIAL